MEIAGESFAEKFDLFGCFQCGKCTGGCAVSLKSQLNPRRLVREAILKETELIFEKEYLWDCTLCGTCTLRCPREIKPSEVIIGMRGVLIEEGRNIPKTIMEALESVFKNGNPWGRARMKRTEWSEDLDVKIKSLPDGDEAEILYYVGCTPAYDPRIQEIARGMVKCFNVAGVDFGILGTEENCCGTEVRRMGEEGLFEMLVEDNLEIFGNYNVKKMVTTSPHCFNTFKNEYDADFEVQHYTQFLSKLIEEEKLTFSKEIEKTITYQDPCFLGKQNEIFDEPRKIIEAIPGVKFIDFDRSRKRSLCCEGGGGRMWVEATGEGERNAEIRVRDAVEMGAEIIATACPFCLLTLEDAVKTTGYEDKIQVRDIIELVSEAI
ncbi:MAG: (Fe-S)-binding protein [Candidatus Syntropharchaeia archaeon]